MKRIINALPVITVLAVLLALALSSGCASFHYPELPGPPNKVDCSIKRDGTLTGVYRCEVEGEYVVKEADFF